MGRRPSRRTRAPAPAVTLKVEIGGRDAWRAERISARRCARRNQVNDCAPSFEASRLHVSDESSSTHSLCCAVVNGHHLTGNANTTMLCVEPVMAMNVFSAFSGFAWIDCA